MRIYKLIIPETEGICFLGCLPSENNIIGHITTIFPNETITSKV